LLNSIKGFFVNEHIQFRKGVLMMSQSTNILVAGGAGEVGEGITRQLLAAGAIVIVPSRSQDKLDQLKAQLHHPANLRTKVADLSSLEGAERLRDELKTELGQLHHVVASLGGWWQGQPLTQISLELWHTLINNSLTAHFITAKTFIPLLQESKGSYTLINGGGALHPVPTAGPISASAAGQLMLGNVLAAENASLGVRVNNLVLATPIKTRSRPDGQADWLSADDAGRYCVQLVQGTSAGETIVFQSSAQLSA
jgi:NAD(P)-dependent dehydrogenase (short-subunit alcohol dehydrogenase family)